MDYCGFDTFTEPVDIRSLVFSLTGFSVSPTTSQQLVCLPAK